MVWTCAAGSCSAPATKVEYDLRTTFYARLQRLPVSFHDRWQSGQLLSRMMQDISMLRRWMAFGVVLLVVNVITIVVGLRAAVPVALAARHDLPGLTSAAALVRRATASRRRYGSLARQSQDQAGDLATSVEESVHGIRVLKAFGRGKHALQKFTQSGRDAAADRAAQGRRGRLDLVLARAAARHRVRAVPRRRHLPRPARPAADLPELIAFFAMATVLRWPMESIGFLFSFLLDARTATDRIFEVFDEENTIVDPDSPETIVEPRGELAFEGVHFRYPDAPAHERICSTASTSCCGRARRWRSSVSPVRARRRSRRCRRACTT